MGGAVDQYGIDARVGGQDLEAVAGGRVAFEDAGDVLSETIEESVKHGVP
jgi:hypothetical protein